MSKVYKRSEIVLGQGKLVDLQINPIIKLNNDEVEQKNTDNIMNDDDKDLNENAETIINKAKEESKQILEDAELEFNKIINKAKEEKDDIISEAYTEANKILESAREKGYNEGLKTGEEKGFKEVESLIEEAKTIKQDILIEKRSTIQSLENEIINLIITSIDKILDYELEKDHSLLLNLVEKGIEKCTYTESLIIRVSPNDYEVVDSSKNRIYLMTEGISSIEIKKDPGLEAGSIIIETESGTVNASLKTQIAQIENAFYNVLKGE